MKLFDCQVCSQTLYFENTKCEKCGHRLGYIAEKQTVVALEQQVIDAAGAANVDGAPQAAESPEGAEAAAARLAAQAGLNSGADGATQPGQAGEIGQADDIWQVAGQPDRTFRFCKNARYNVCNWLIPAADEATYCLACRHNHIVPDLDKKGNHELWRLMEIAKHRLIYTLLELNLPMVPRRQDPEEGLMFDFLEDASPKKKVLTGHDHGHITINIAEADDAERERRRKSMHEPYRTLLGHFRHEIGHYYWDRLVRDSVVLDACREVFGDERDDYNAALQRHYKEGAPANWRDRYVSAYATCHAWEDFAETFAHYLHIVDTLETAEAFGVRLRPRAAEGAKLATTVDFAPDRAKTFEPLVKAWVPLTFALNSLNRSMGLGDLYPFVLTPVIVDKLGFIHDLVHGTVKVDDVAQPFSGSDTPVPTEVPPPPSPSFVAS